MVAATSVAAENSSAPLSDQTTVQDNSTNDTAASDSALRNAADLTSPENSELITNNLKLVQADNTLSTEWPTVTINFDEPAENATRQVDAFGDEPEPEKPTPANVKKDDSGRVVEVDYPNGTTRTFGYDEEGHLNKIVQPDGRTLVLKDGKWDFALPESTSGGTGSGGAGAMSGGSAHGNHAISALRDPNMVNPVINPDGTFTYQTREGAFINLYADGTQSRVSNGAIVTSDINSQVTGIHYPDGTQRQFTYQADGGLATVTENGSTYTVADGELIGSDGKPTGIKNVDVTHDGTYHFRDADGNEIDLRSNLARDMRKPDGSVVRSDAKGQIAQIDYPDGTTRMFGYDDKGNLNRITDKDGKEYHFEELASLFGKPIGLWKDADGNPAPFKAAEIGADGTITQTLTNGRIERTFTTGATQRTDGTQDQIAETAKNIHDAANKSFGPIGTPDTDQINKMLDRLSVADREQLMLQYKQMYGVSLTEELHNKLGNSAGHAEMLLSGADLRTQGLKTFSNPKDREMWDRTVESFERRAKAQGMSEADIAKHEREYLASLQSKAADGKSGADLIRDVQKEMAKDAKPEVIEVSTDHFNIQVQNFGDVTPEQIEQLKKTLEEAYKKFQDYYGVDVNSVFGKKFDFKVISPEELGWSGGGTYDTTSAITNDLFPNLLSDDPAAREGVLNIIYHELANGWASLYAGYNGKGTNIPGWYGAEGQAGFYKSHLLIDQGYAGSVDAEYDRALKDFEDYQKNVKDGVKPTPGQDSAASHVIVESLYQKFGYGPMQEIDKKIQFGELKFDESASAEENNGRLIYALSQATNTNLLDFMDKYNIKVTPEWRQKIEALGYAPSEMRLATDSGTPRPPTRPTPPERPPVEPVPPPHESEPVTPPRAGEPVTPPRAGEPVTPPREREPVTPPRAGEPVTPPRERIVTPSDREPRSN